MSQMLYQQMILDHSKHPKGFCEDPQGSCEQGRNPMCGDEIQFCCEVTDGIITNMTYRASGCSISVASASVLVSVIKSTPAANFDHVMQNYLNMLKGNDYQQLPKKLEVFSGVCQYPMRVKCASFSWHAAKSALAQAQQPIILSKSAKDYWLSLVAAENASGILLTFKQVGCMGWQFVPSVETKQPKDSISLQYGALLVYVPHEVLQTIKGTKVDFEMSSMGEGKVIFNHPKAQEHCGCGESFLMSIDSTISTPRAEELG